MNYGKWLSAAAGLFIFGLMLGLLLPTGSGSVFLAEAAALDEMADIITPLPQIAVFILIFLKNVSVIAFSFVLSPLLCLVPAVTLFFNGGVIGLISAIIAEKESFPFLMAGLLPHGIFEIPALLMGEAVALSFGVAVLRGIFSKGKKDIIMSNFRSNLKFLAISAGLFLVAAGVETFVTPLLLERVG